MTTTFYICAGLGWLVTCAVCYALGWTEGRKQGEMDGLEQAAAECEWVKKNYNIKEDKPNG